LCRRAGWARFCCQAMRVAVLEFFTVRRAREFFLSSLFLLAFAVSVSFGSWLTARPALPVCETVSVPDTVTPEDIIALGIRHLTHNLDAESGHLPFFTTEIEDGRLVSSHSGWDYVDISSRYLEALWLARKASGDMSGFDEELALRKTLYSYRGEDGLFYRQKSDFYPYAEAHTADQASALRFLLTVYGDTRSPEVKKIIEGVLAGLVERAEETRLGLRFDCPTYNPDSKCGLGGKLFHRDPIQFFARLARTIEEYHALESKNDAAKRLSAGLLEYIKRESGVFKEKWGFDGQTHSRLNALIGLFEYAKETGDAALAKYVQDQVWFLFTRGAQFGWVPEVIDRGNPKNPHATWSETCSVVDFLELVMMLAKDDPLFWEMADQIVRNQLVEAQFHDRTLLPKGLSEGEKNRLLGSFCGYCGVCSWSDHTMNCCSASGVRGWTLVWQRAITGDADGVWINLSINHATGDVLVTSERPHNGRVAVTSKRAGTFYLRIPVWVLKREVKLDGKPYKGEWKKRYYMVLRADKPAVRWVVDYPLPTRETFIEVGGTRYKVRWKGNTVYSIKPKSDRGRKPIAFPTYNRERLRLKSFRLVPKRLCWPKND